jgi:hypothetical protein
LYPETSVNTWRSGIELQSVPSLATFLYNLEKFFGWQFMKGNEKLGREKTVFISVLI